jgi:hypothetical protein
MSIFRTSGLSTWLFAIGFALLICPVGGEAKAREG